MPILRLLLMALAGLLPAAPAAHARPARSHVVTIVLENKERGQVIGSRHAPFLTRFARRHGRATRSYGIRHPSLPNYIALTSGGTHGIVTDCTGCRTGARSIADQLEAHRLSWRAYAEGYPGGCFDGATSGRYAKRHVPFLYYDRIVSDPARCRHVRGFGRLHRDLRRDRLPAYALIVPDLCHDMHDCGVRAGDRFMRRLVPRVLRHLGPHGFLVVTFDEGGSDAGCCGSARGGRIPTIVAGPDVRRRARLRRPVDHYGVLRTVERALGLRRLGHARQARHGSLRPLFRRAPRVR